MLNLTPIESERFWANVDTAGDCWLWLGAVNDNGYGRHSWRRRRVMAHRSAYTQLVGEIGEGLQIDHLCKVRLCVNPDHLEAVTQYVNIMRSDAPTSVNAKRTACIRGHVFDNANTYMTRDGRRQCRECIRARGRKFEASRRTA